MPVFGPYEVNFFNKTMEAWPLYTIDSVASFFPAGPPDTPPQSDEDLEPIVLIPVIDANALDPHLPNYYYDREDAVVPATPDASPALREPAPDQQQQQQQHRQRPARAAAKRPLHEIQLQQQQQPCTRAFLKRQRLLSTVQQQPYHTRRWKANLRSQHGHVADDAIDSMLSTLHNRSRSRERTVVDYIY